MRTRLMTRVRLSPFGRYVTRIVSRYLYLPTLVTRVVVYDLRTRRRLVLPICTLICGSAVRAAVDDFASATAGTTNPKVPSINVDSNNFLMIYPLFF